MIGTIRRHQNWLWGIVIAATIITFLYAFLPTNRYGSGEGPSSSGPNLGSINGEPVTLEQFQAAEREGRLFFGLRGTWPDSEEQKKQVQRWADQSLVLQYLMKEYNINPTTDAAARLTKQMFGVAPDQAMPLDKYNGWVQNELMRKGGLTPDDLARFARDQAGQETLISLFGMPGKLMTPKEAEFFYRRENEPLVTEIVSFPTTNFYAATAPSETELQDYFTKHEAEYRLPDRIQVNYVVFDPSNYTAQAAQLLGTNIDDKVDEYYHQQGPDAFKDESGHPLDQAAAQAKIKKQMRLMAGMHEARKDGSAFLADLSEGRDAAHPYSPSDLEKLAKTRRLAVKTTEPFDEKDGSKDLDISPKSLRMLFSLRENEPDDPEKSMLYPQSPIIGETNIFVVGLQKRFPSALQTLASVRDKVVKDYRQAKALALARDAGEKFAAALQVGQTQGKSFDAVCAAQNVKPETLPPFAATTTNVPPGMDKLSFQQLQDNVCPMPTGQVSKFIPTTDGGVVAYVKGRLPVDEARMAQELPLYLARMRDQLQIAAFQDWFGRQMHLLWMPPPSDQAGAG
jgi:hypothetical protein